MSPFFALSPTQAKPLYILEGRIAFTVSLALLPTQDTASPALSTTAVTASSTFSVPDSTTSSTLSATFSTTPVTVSAASVMIPTVRPPIFWTVSIVPLMTLETGVGKTFSTVSCTLSITELTAPLAFLTTQSAPLTTAFPAPLTPIQTPLLTDLIPPHMRPKKPGLLVFLDAKTMGVTKCSEDGTDDTMASSSSAFVTSSSSAFGVSAVVAASIAPRRVVRPAVCDFDLPMSIESEYR